MIIKDYTFKGVEVKDAEFTITGISLTTGTMHYLVSISAKGSLEVLDTKQFCCAYKNGDAFKEADADFATRAFCD